MREDSDGCFYCGDLLRGCHAGWTFLLAAFMTIEDDASLQLQGSESNWEKIMAAGKEDVLSLVSFAMLKVEQFAVAIMEK